MPRIAAMQYTALGCPPVEMPNHTITVFYRRVFDAIRGAKLRYLSS